MGDGGCDDNDDDSDDEMDEEIPESTRGRAMSNMSRMGGMQARKVINPILCLFFEITEGCHRTLAHVNVSRYSRINK